nr:putative late blight resistance protein homolog R1A-4 [Ipomoea batatas]
MAYAAITSLKGTLYLHFLQSQPCLPLIYKPKVVSLLRNNLGFLLEIVYALHKNLGFLQDILEKSEITIGYDNSAMKRLEAEMRDVAFKAEERIEMELSNIYLQSSSIEEVCLFRLHGILNEAVKQTDYLKKKLIKIQKLFEHYNMQSFILRGAADTFDFFVASGIWKMPLLRNFCIQGIGSLGTSSIVHRNLESISWLDSMLCTKDLFTRIPNLKKLGIYGGYDKNNLDCFYNFVHLRQLEELSIRAWWNLNHIPCSGIQWATSFLPKLKKLKFFDTKLQWSDMRLFGMLPNLQVLKLINSIASEDRMWEPSEEGFRQLKRLVIEDVFFERWNAVGDNFSVLECLELRNCYSLQEIPSGFANITTLVLIQLKSCLDSVLASAKLIQEEQYNNYGNAVLVCSENIKAKRVKTKSKNGMRRMRDE